MRRLLFLLSVLAGCSTLSQMNSNLENSNQMLEKNTTTVQHSSEVIQKNTEEVAKSTRNMQIVFPLLGIGLLALLFYPSFKLIKLQRKLLQDISEKMKR